MLNVTTADVLSKILEANLDIRFKKDGENYCPFKNPNWETLNPIVIKGNHYKVEGLG